MLTYLPMHINVAIGCVILVLLISVLSNNFTGTANVKYTDWFVKKINMLLDTAVLKAEEGDQNQDPICASQSYTTALTIMDTLEYLVKDPNHLDMLGKMNNRAFSKHVLDQRTLAVRKASSRTTPCPS